MYYLYSSYIINCIYKLSEAGTLLQAYHLIAPVPHKRPVNTGSPPTLHPLSAATRNTSQAGSETTREDDDWTGDSGMGTGSGSAADETAVWKKAMKNPPPGMCQCYTYTCICMIFAC